MPNKRPVPLNLNFRQLVKACASDPEIVAQFNAAHKVDMPCPISSLVGPPMDLENEPDEKMIKVSLFILWVQQTYWLRAKAAQTNMSKLACRVRGPVVQRGLL